MSPRPILKVASDSDSDSSSPNALPFAAYSRFQLDSPHVHFPPTPTLTRTVTTHSPNAYDRAPIIVLPNSCALPERGGRVYTPRLIDHGPPKGSYFHPRAFEACEREILDASSPPIEPPALVPDRSSSESSESSDSDDYDSPPCSSIPNVSIHSSSSAHRPIPRTHSQEEFDLALSFLPHPPSQMKDKECSQRSRRLAKMADRAEARLSRVSTFQDLSLDGCLGGF